ncbi:MAG TPA: molybdopterin-dependent oxidoreductase, partial [Candidatus Dormibacteraeota bacterium]|nr:molybdopterin-dependent oxidoreductase [Candidatus Dormibacteraeota bacterium]
GRGRRLGISLPQDVTNEELYLLSRLLAGPWKGARVTLERRSLLPPPPPEAMSIRDLDACRVLVVVASDTADDVPVVNLRLKKAVKKLGARLVIVHPRDLDLDRWPQAVHVRPEPGGAAAAVRALAGHELLREGPVGILWGDGRGTEPIGELAAAVAELAAAGIVGAPDDLDGCEAVICWGPPPLGRIPASARFTAVWDILLRPEHGRPDLVLPDLSFAETQGSYTNLEGRVQFVRPALVPRPPLREGWEVLAEIGQRLGMAGMEYAGIFQIQREAARAIPAFAPLAGPPDPQPEPTPVLYGPARP